MCRKSSEESSESECNGHSHALAKLVKMFSISPSTKRTLEALVVTDFLEEGSDNWKMLADTSLLLLLLFTNYCTDTSAFRNLNTEAHFRLSYPALFSVLADTLHTEDATLLLYLLLHRWCHKFV